MLPLLFLKKGSGFRVSVRALTFPLIARILLLSYSLLLLKPVMPVLQDRIAHRFNASAHFQLAHKHGGATHVHQEMNKLEKEENGKHSTPPVKTAKEEVCIKQEGSALCEQLSYPLTKEYSFLPHLNDTGSGTLSPEGPPPRA